MRKYVLTVVVLFVSCGGSVVPLPEDAGTSPRDAGDIDSGISVDAGEPDSGTVVDAGTIDSGTVFDAGIPDAGVPDAGTIVDAGSLCAPANGGCDALTTCDDSDGGVTCGACPLGYSGDGVSGCVNIDECAPDAGDPCGPLRTCMDMPGGYQCGDCITGYALDGGACVDVNECTFDGGVCDVMTTCTNTPGDFACSACPGPTLTGNGKTGCVLQPPRIQSARAVSTCTTMGRGLPKSYGQATITDDGIESGYATYDLTVSGFDGGTPRVVVTDFASGMTLSSSNTHFSGRGMIFDIAIAVLTSNVISQTTGGGVFTMRYCRQAFGGAPCAELRDAITFDDSSSVITTSCDAPPQLDPASDLGEANDDDFTSDFTPTFTVSSTASTVTWLRDGVVMGTTPVVNGTATWTDDGTATPGDHGYSVKHGPGAVPSAQRHVILSTGPAPRLP